MTYAFTAANASQSASSNCASWQTWSSDTNPANHPLLNNGHYYRSQLFNYHIGVNPLISAASPLLILATHLANAPRVNDIYALFQQLQHEIKAFENSAKIQRYRSETILISRYLLCALLDELVLHSPNEKATEWQNHRLLRFFHQEENSHERFFVILERLAADASLHIDLLELIYLCLKLGYQGKYRHTEQGQEQLTTLTNRLFECICAERGDLKKELNISPPHTSPLMVTSSSLPLWLIGSFTLAVLLTIYSGFSYLLSHSAQQAYQQALSLLTTTANFIKP